MSDSDNAHQAAIQYLLWAVEEIEKAANPEAARHALAALESLRDSKSEAI